MKEEMRMSSNAGVLFCGVLALLLCASCAVFSPSLRLEDVDLGVQERRNGFLVEFRTGADIPDGVTTIIAPPNWLIVTVPHALLDTTSVSHFRSSAVDSTEVHRFESVTQFSLRFRKSISSAEILRSPRLNGLTISVFF